MQAATYPARQIVLEFYTTRPAIGIYPLRPNVTEDDILERIRRGGYFTIKAAAYEDAFEHLKGLIDDDTVFVSTTEKLIGVVRYRQFENVGSSVKFESVK